MAETKKEKKKVTQSTDCKNGKHTFIVTRWQVKGGFEKAVAMRCQHCLVPLDMDEIEMKEWRESEGI